MQPTKSIFRFAFLIFPTLLGCLDVVEACHGPVEISYGSFENVSSPEVGCCVPEGSRVLRCSSLDVALAAIELGNQTATTVQVDLNATADNSFTMNGAFQVDNVRNLTIRGVGGRASILCTGESSRLLVIGAEFFTLNNVQVSHSPTVAVSCWNCGAMSVLNCNFIDNRGGGFAVKLTGTTSFRQHSILVDNSKFNKNRGNAGALALSYTTVPLDNEDLLLEIDIINTNFTDNRAVDAGSGGGLSATFNQATKVSSVKINIAGCRFENNHADEVGGGFSYYVSSSLFRSSINISDCTFINNMAQNGAAVHTDSTVYYDLYLRSTSFVNNKISQAPFGTKSLGVVYILNADVNVNEENAFVQNQGTPLCLDLSYLIVKPGASVFFVENQGTRGGGLNLVHSASIGMSSESFLNFSRNSAEFGGAIFQNTGNSLSNPCMFEDFMGGFLYFYNNTAKDNSGNSIYFYEPSADCYDELRENRDNLIGLSIENCQDVGSTAVTLEIDNTDITLSLGQTIHLNTTVMEKFVPHCQSELTAVLSVPADSEYNLTGNTAIVVSSERLLTSARFMGPEILDNDTATIELTVRDTTKVIHVDVTLLSCRVGYIYDELQRQCSCADDVFEDLRTYITCDEERAAAYIREGFWIGEVLNTTVVSRCYNGFCSNLDMSLCEPCSDCDRISNRPFCRLVEDQCVGNRSGTVCGDCEDGFSFTYGAVLCVPSSTCSGAKAVIPWLLILTFLILDVTLLVVFLKVGSRIKSAYLFCFVYYFSIAKYILPPFRSSTGLRAFLAIFESITQLNPLFLGYIPICFSDIQSFLHLPFQYLNPVLIVAAVLIVIFLFQYLPCKHKIIKFHDNTSIRAITVLMLLSFTALSETSFNIINPVIFEPLTQAFVSFQPSVSYFGKNSHIWWFIVALLVEVFLILPFILALLFTPMLRRCVNLNKVKPILDEFQGHYRDNYQWVSGLYFVARLAYMCILVYPPATGFSVNGFILQIISVIVAFLHVVLQPYKDQWLNTIDFILLTDLVFLSLLNGPASDQVFVEAPIVKEVLLFILLIIPVLYIIGLFLGSSTLPEKALNSLRNHIKVNQTKTAPNHEVSVRIHRNYQPGAYREPLLDYLDSEGTTRRIRSTNNPRIVDRQNATPSYYEISYENDNDDSLPSYHEDEERPTDHELTTSTV